MKNRYWPRTAKIRNWGMTVTAHNRGAANSGGHYAFARGSGARWMGSLEVVPSRPADGQAFRAFLHSLRGRGGTFFLRLPATHAPRIVSGTNPLGHDDTRFTDDFIFADTTVFADAWFQAVAANGDEENPLGHDETRFADDSFFSDGSTFDEPWGLPRTMTGELFSEAVLGSDIIDIGSLASSPLVMPGAFLFIGEPHDGGQLVRVVSVADEMATVRPRLRRAYPEGTLIEAGAVTACFRLDMDTPAIPMIGDRAQGLSLQIAEAY